MNKKYTLLAIALLLGQSSLDKTKTINPIVTDIQQYTLLFKTEYSNPQMLLLDIGDVYYYEKDNKDTKDPDVLNAFKEAKDAARKAFASLFPKETFPTNADATYKILEKYQNAEVKKDPAPIVLSTPEPIAKDCPKCPDPVPCPPCPAPTKCPTLPECPVCPEPQKAVCPPCIQKECPKCPDPVSCPAPTKCPEVTCPPCVQKELTLDEKFAMAQTLPYPHILEVIQEKNPALSFSLDNLSDTQKKYIQDLIDALKSLDALLQKTVNSKALKDAPKDSLTNVRTFLRNRLLEICTNI